MSTFRKGWTAECIHALFHSKLPACIITRYNECYRQFIYYHYIKSR